MLTGESTVTGEMETWECAGLREGLKGRGVESKDKETREKGS